MSVKNSYIAASVICPFYVDDNGVRIRCEGLDSAQYTHRIFESYEKRKDFMEKHCCRFKSGCSIARALEEKYREEKN